MTASGIEPATLRLVAQCLNHLPYDVPLAAFTFFLLHFHRISRRITTAKAYHLTRIPLLLHAFPSEVAPLSTPLFSAHKAYLNLVKAVAWSLIMICGCGPLMIHFIFSPSGRSLDSNCWFSNLTLSRFVSSLSEANTSYLTSSRRIQAVSITAEGFPTCL